MGLANLKRLSDLINISGAVVQKYERKCKQFMLVQEWTKETREIRRLHQLQIIKTLPILRDEGRRWIRHI